MTEKRRALTAEYRYVPGEMGKMCETCLDKVWKHHKDSARKAGRKPMKRTKASARSPVKRLEEAAKQNKTVVLKYLEHAREVIAALQRDVDHLRS